MGAHTNQNPIYIDCDASAPSSDHGNISNPYESWRAMIDGQGRDITSAGVITIYMKGVNGATSNKGNRGGGDGSGCDYTTVADTYAFSGTFNASNHIDLKAWPGSEGDGSFDSAPSFTGDPGSSYLFNLEEYCEWDGIDIKYSGGLSNRYGLFISENAKVRNFIIQNNGSRSIHFQQAVEISNGIVYGTSGVEAETNYQSDTYLSYLTVINDGSGGSAFNSGTTSNNLVLKNCVAYGGWTDEFDGTSSNYDSASTNNAGETASASVPTNIQTNYVEISSDPFADSASDDYSVEAGSALIDGTPVSGITTDIIGTTRDGTTPTIGAFEVSSAPEHTSSGTPTSGDSSASGTAERELPASGTPQAQAAATAGTSSRGQAASGTPSAQTATTSGAAERVLVCNGELLAGASSASGTALLQVKLLLTAAAGQELRDEEGVLVTVSGIIYEWYDKTTDTEGDPDASGTFDAVAGDATVQLAGSTLSAGQEGTLILKHPSDPAIRGTYIIPVV